MDIKASLKKILEGKHLSEEESFECFSALFDKKVTEAQAGAFLFGLKVKRETPYELNGAIRAALKRAKLLKLKESKIIDTCGTGGDGKGSFNCSTAVALFLADMGYKVVKHGNRAVSSKCGSADVVEKLNIPFPKEELEVESSLNKFNFAFLYAPYFHPSFKNIAPVRKSLGVPTIFNLMGPLLNPAIPKYQLIGVSDPKVMDAMASVLKERKIKRAAVIHGAEGFDEITPFGPSMAMVVEGERTEKIFIDPKEFNLFSESLEEVLCNTKEDALAKMKQTLLGKAPLAIKNMVSLNLGMCIFLLEEKLSLKECMDIAKEKVNQGIVNIRRFVEC